MRFEDCLAFCPINYLQQVAREHHLETVMYSKSSLLQELLNKFRNPAFIRNAVERLTEVEKLALKIILFAGSAKGINTSDAIEQVSLLLKTKLEEAEAHIESVVRKGFVFKVLNDYESEICLVPSDLAQMLVEIFLVEVTDSIDITGSNPEEYREDGIALLTDVFRLVAGVAKNEVKLTQKGLIYKRNYKALIDGFVIKEDTDADDGEYGLRFRLILDYALQKNLIQEHEGHYQVANGLPGWLSLSAELQLQDVFEFWQSYYGRTNPYLDTFLAVLRRLPVKEWISYTVVVECLHRIMVSNVSAAYASQLGLEALQQLLFMGALSIGFAGSDMVFRITDIGAHLLGQNHTEQWLPQETHFFIQPNYEVLVPQSIDKRILWQIEELAELKQADKMMVYHLNKNSLYYALQQGWQAEQIKTYLKTYSRNKLPQNVEFAINNWAASYGQMYFLKACLLRCADEKTADEILATPKFKKYVKGKLTSTDLLVHLEDYQAFLEALQQEGYMPFTGLFTPTNEPGYGRE